MTAGHHTVSPEAYVERLIELSRREDDQPLREALLRLLGERFGADSIKNEVSKRYESIRDSSPHALTGGLGVFLAFSCAERDDLDEANRYLGNSVVRDFLFDQYQVSAQFRSRSLILHRTGTTSFILRIRPPDYVLKVIKPQYWSSSMIADLTSSYDLRFESLTYQHTPTVRESAAKYVVMDFVSGPTLREYISGLWETDADIVTVAKQIGDQLLLILDSYDQRGEHHLDLSPDNILVETSFVGEQPIHLQLIDFGYNYILIEGIRTPGVETYIAPEMFDGIPDDPALADIYSVAIIILEILSSRRLSLRDVGDQLEVVGDEYPGIGDVLFDALEENPENRLRDKPDQRVHLYMKERFDAEIELSLHVFGRDSWSWLIGLVMGLDLLGFPSLGILITQAKRWIFIKRRRIEAPGTNTLFGFAILAGAVHIADVVAIAFVVNKGWHPATADEITGLVVAFSFSAVATRYYLNIFSTLSTKGLSRNTERLMRLNSFFHGIPVLATILYDPTSWPLFAASGFVVILLNNLMSYRFCDTVKEELPVTLASPRSRMERFLTEYSPWWQNILGYTILLFTLGALNKFDVIPQLWPFAIATIFINAKMYFQNCGTAAPRIRGGLRDCVRSAARA